jgi:lipoprotein-anchoring transpeptidase ErfK/SrfK
LLPDPIAVKKPRTLLIASALLGAAWLALSPAAFASNNRRAISMPMPAAGDLTVLKAVAHSTPSASGARVLVLHQFRPDFRRQEVLAVASTLGSDGNVWYKLNLPMRPNGMTGWVQASQVELKPVTTRILININARRLEVLRGKNVLYKTTVAVGRPGMETPVGHFYVQVRFHPDDPFLGVFAFETSAYSKLTDWPGGGVVGIHGTSAPQLLGQAVSHGCVRMSNEAATALKRLVPVGTPITIVQG